MTVDKYLSWRLFNGQISLCSLWVRTGSQIKEKLKQRCFSKHKTHTSCQNWPWPSNSCKQGTKHVFRVNLAQIHSAVPAISAENLVFCQWWPWPLTLTFKLVQARDQPCLPFEFGANPFSGSRDISYTNKQKSHRQHQKQNLTQFTACGNKTGTFQWDREAAHVINKTLEELVQFGVCN